MCAGEGYKQDKGGAPQGSLQRSLLCACRTLAAGVVNGVLAVQQKLGDGDEGVALLQQRFNNSGQGFRGMQGGVVEQNDGAGLHLAGHPLGDLAGGQLLPVQTVPTGNAFKRLGNSGLETRKESWGAVTPGMQNTNRMNISGSAVLAMPEMLFIRREIERLLYPAQRKSRGGFRRPCAAGTSRRGCRPAASRAGAS